MRLEIALVNVFLIITMLRHFGYLKDTKKLNARIFFWIMLTSVFLIGLEYISMVLPLMGNGLFLDRLVRALYYILIPVYANLSVLYTDTWVFGINQASRRYLILLNVNLIINTLNIVVWYFNPLTSSTTSLSGVFRNLTMLMMFLPFAYTWVKLMVSWKTSDHQAILEITVISLPIIVGGMAQFLVKDLPSFWTGAILSQILVFFNLLNGHSLKDALTQLGNRRALRHDWNRAFNRKMKPYLGGFLIDVDDFKSINDKHGHAMGDEVLVEVARLLEQSRHSSDLIYRLGGDEFIVLAELDKPSELQIIQKRIEENCRYVNLREHYPFTLSISIGMLVVKKQEGWSMDDFLAIMDQKMYEEKALHHTQID